ncbi:MAG: DUF3078 domain-containing protein, partial [Muribaculaceae bacterium]|nr:DUF3078 domain-containing protein [Muribaculaceae bacterium]
MRHLTLAIFIGMATLSFAQDFAMNARNSSQLKNISSAEYAANLLAENIAVADSLALDSNLYKPVVIRDLDEILQSLPDTMPELPYNLIVGPWVFSGHRDLNERTYQDLIDNAGIKNFESKAIVENNYMPNWLHDAVAQSRITQDYMYKTMVYTPDAIQFTYWDLPVPPRLPEDDITLGSYIRNLNLPEVTLDDSIIPEFEQKKIHWLHNFSTGLQFSQAYVSKNWYQGGNDYLAILYNFYWDVQLNQTYHPNQIFQSTVNYKFAANSIEKNAVGRNYSISEDNFQY